MKKQTTTPVILVTNDDSILAPGIHALVNAVRKLGKIIVVAPDKAQSGMGHAITIGQPIRLQKYEGFGPDVDAYQCSGTPVDCVKIAVANILHAKPTICVSGINHGANHSINVIYSGTMSAAVEAAVEDIPSIGFSLLDYSWEADFSHVESYIQQLVTSVINSKKIKNYCLNVNIPAKTKKPIKGIKVCRQANAKYQERFDERTDPHGKKYYWLTGEFVNFDKGRDTDVAALKNNYISVVPVQFDLTSHGHINHTKKLVEHIHEEG